MTSKTRDRIYLGLIGYTIFSLAFVSVGIRWHTYRARASLYATQEMEHTFEAANLERAAKSAGYAEGGFEKAQSYRNLARMHQKAADEAAKLRAVYENVW